MTMVSSSSFGRLALRRDCSRSRGLDPLMGVQAQVLSPALDSKGHLEKTMVTANRHPGPLMTYRTSYRAGPIVCQIGRVCCLSFDPGPSVEIAKLHRIDCLVRSAPASVSLRRRQAI